MFVSALIVHYLISRLNSNRKINIFFQIISLLNSFDEMCDFSDKFDPLIKQ